MTKKKNDAPAAPENNAPVVGAVGTSEPQAPEEGTEPQAPETEPKAGEGAAPETEPKAPEPAVEPKASEPAPNNAPAVTVVAESGPKLYKVRFLKEHTMTIALQRKAFKPKDEAKVELHTANALSERHIAVLIG